MFSKRKNQAAEVEEADGNGMAKAIACARPFVDAKFDVATAQRLPRRDLASEIRVLASDALDRKSVV